MKVPMPTAALLSPGGTPAVYTTTAFQYIHPLLDNICCFRRLVLHRQSRSGQAG